MDQELKQRLIGAAVITALAAIFVPMLFDDPIDESGKTVNELKIPELPAKAQDVEIMPLPEKVEDVATEAPVERPARPLPAPVAPSAPAKVLDEGDQDGEWAPSRSSTQISAKNTSVAPAPGKWIEPDADMAAAEDDMPAPQPVPAAKPQPAIEMPVAKVAKPAPAAAPVTAPAVSAETAATRWYLNVGSFGQKANAVSLHDSLKQQGFAVSIKEAVGEKGTIYKVRVGPLMDKAKAQAVKNKLTQINVNSFVYGDD